ncbi:HDOD domain-containing protein, partial [bacterium]|nr:HDOD domain-containing protein [bacterium]
PKTSVEDVTRIIRMDQAQTARLLKIDNSAFYGFPRQISTVTQAIVILGFNAVKSLALSASIVQVFGTKGREGFDLEAFWEHSISTGVIANMVGRRINYPLPEECLIAGILHGIGKLIFDQYLHNLFMEAVAKARKTKKLLQHTEREIFGTDHCRVGAMLAEKWKLPLQLVESINYYPVPGQANFNPTLVSLVHVGNYVARKKRCGDPGDQVVPKLSEDAKKTLKLTQGDIDHIIRDSQADLAKVADLLDKLID